MRWDSPFVLAAAGTIAIHLVLVVFGDAMVITHPQRPEPPPKLELVDVEVPAIVKPPPPPVARPEPAPQEPPKQPVVAHKAVHAPAQPEPPTPLPPPPPSPSAEPDPGGEQVVTLPAAETGAVGVPVAVGHPSTGHIGRGGSGGGTGSGVGSGAGEVPKPMSVATIKKRAMPRGDYGFESTKEYPAEAKQLGIEGAIRVRLIVDEHGKVKSTTLLNKLGHGLDELALRRAAVIEFDPALDEEDRPVTSVVVWTFTMTLPK